jgi:DNA-binding transcriptional MerR regulator
MLQIVHLVVTNSLRGGYKMYSPFMRAYTVGEVSKILDVPPSTIRQWEKDLEGVLHVPRDDKGNRYYTDFQLQTLRTVKRLRDKGMSFELIRDIVRQDEGSTGLTVSEPNLMPVMAQSEAIEAIRQLQEAVQALSERVESIVRYEVRKEVTSLRNEVAAAISNEIANIRKEITSTSQLLSELKTQQQEVAITGSKQLEALSEQMKTQQQAIETVITETRAERHKRKSWWKFWK